jgi:diadenosine tetraphosphate (Ap4A) HIT family hydrolase
MIRADCVYCTRTAETVVWSDPRCRVLHVAGSDFAGLCRVVWNRHVAEFSDLDAAEREHLMRVVAGVEAGLRDLLAPDKINLASLGTGLPHLHWHVIPRYRDDSHFPEPIWAAPQRVATVRELPPDFAPRMQRAVDAAVRAPA